MNQANLKNLFTPNAPVQTFELFFGRQEEAANILAFLAQAQSVSVIGPKQIGKSSLLNHLAHPQLWEKHGLSADAFHVIYLNCEKFAEIDRKGFFAYVGKRAAKESTNTFSELFELCRRQYAMAGSTTLVVMLDTFEALMNNSQADYDFFSNLRSLNTNHRVVYVTASQISLSELEQGKFGKMESSQFSNIFNSLQLEGLEEESVKKLLGNYLARAELPLKSVVIPPFANRHGFARVREWIHDRFSGNNRDGWKPLVETIVAEAKGRPKLIQQMGAQAVEAWFACKDQDWDIASARALRQRFNELHPQSDSS